MSDMRRKNGGGRSRGTSVAEQSRRNTVSRRKAPKLSRVFEALPALPDDALPDEIPDHPAEPRPLTPR
jgi:hypothetical protein